MKIFLIGEKDEELLRAIRIAYQNQLAKVLGRPLPWVGFLLNVQHFKSEQALADMYINLAIIRGDVQTITKKEGADS